MSLQKTQALKKKNILILIILVIGVLGFLKLNNDFLMFWNSNKVNVKTEIPLSKDKVKIELGISVNTISRTNDLDLFSKRGKYTLIYDGRNENQIFNDYGENDFLITYANEYYLSFRQFKINRKHQHKYNFKFYKEEGDILLNVKIIGKDGMSFQRKMLSIKDTQKYVCNTPIDSVCGVYNMIDLKKK